MMGDRFTIPGFEGRPAFTGLAFVPGSDAYVRELRDGRFLVGKLGHTDPRPIATLPAAIAAAKQLAKVPGTNVVADVAAYDAFWGTFQGAPPPPPPPDVIAGPTPAPAVVGSSAPPRRFWPDTPGRRVAAVGGTAGLLSLVVRALWPKKRRR